MPTPSRPRWPPWRTRARRDRRPPAGFPARSMAPPGGTALPRVPRGRAEGRPRRAGTCRRRPDACPSWPKGSRVGPGRLPRRGMHRGARPAHACPGFAAGRLMSGAAGVRRSGGNPCAAARCPSRGVPVRVAGRRDPRLPERCPATSYRLGRLRLARVGRRGDGRGLYRPHPWIGATVTALPVGRLAWHGLLPIPHPGSAGPLAADGGSPLTRRVAVRVVGCCARCCAGSWVRHGGSCAHAREPCGRAGRVPAAPMRRRRQPCG